MNGPQDLGGAQGFGPVVAETDEPPFHADWERRVFALALAMGFTGAWSLDASRAARESLPPANYLAFSYYRIWFEALEAQLLVGGFVNRSELASGASDTPPLPDLRVLRGEDVTPLFDTGFPSERPGRDSARFAVGEAVTARNVHPMGHTRLPRYVRGRRGTIERVHGAFAFPDASARGTEAPPQWLYTVGFDASELWGESADPGGRVTIAAFESYLASCGSA